MLLDLVACTVLYYHWSLTFNNRLFRGIDFSYIYIYIYIFTHCLLIQITSIKSNLTSWTVSLRVCFHVNVFLSM